MRLSIFRVRTLAVADMVLLLVASGMFGMFFFASLYVQEILGYSPLQAGLAFLPVTAGIVIGAGIAQHARSRSIGVRDVALVGISLAAAGMAWLTQVPVHGSYARRSARRPAADEHRHGPRRSCRSRCSAPAASAATTPGWPRACSTPPSRSAARSGSRSSRRSRRARPASLLHGASSGRNGAIAARVSGYQVAFLAAAIMLAIGGVDPRGRPPAPATSRASSSS